MFAGHHSSHATKIWKGVFSCQFKTWGHICHAVRVHSLCSDKWWLYCFRDKFLVKGPYVHYHWCAKQRVILSPNEKFPGMTEMLAILLLQASEKCPVTGDFCRLHKDIGNLYDESSAKQVSLRVPIYISKVDHNPHSWMYIQNFCFQVWPHFSKALLDDKLCKEKEGEQCLFPQPNWLALKKKKKIKKKTSKENTSYVGTKNIWWPTTERIVLYVSKGFTTAW